MLFNLGFGSMRSKTTRVLSSSSKELLIMDDNKDKVNEESIKEYQKDYSE